MNAIDLDDSWTITCLQAIANLGDGWFTQDEAVWTVFNNAQVIRGRTRQILESLADQNVIERLIVRHRGKPFPCYLLDQRAVRALLHSQVAA